MLRRVFTFVFLSFQVFALEEVEVSSPQKLKINSESQQIEPLTSRRSSFHQNESSFSSFLDLRQKKRVGLGMQVMGKGGALSGNLELNLSSRDSLEVFYGGGSNLSATGLQWKKYFGERKIAPFVGGGLAYWYNASEKSISSTTPSYLGNTLLSEEEKREGRFGLNLIQLSTGLNYYFLQGDWAQSSIFGEIVWLRPIDRTVQVFSAGFGYQFIF